MSKRWWALAGAVATFLALPISGASAHAEFLGSNPVDGSVLATAPPVAELRFSEEVLLGASHVTLLQLGTGTTTELRIAGIDGGRTVRATLPTITRGAFILRYVAVDPADLHKTVGSISFGVGVAAPPSQRGEQLDGSWASTAVRSITDGALVLGAGAVIVIWLAVRRREGAIARATRLASICACVTAAGWVVLLLSDAATVGWQRVRWRSLLISSDPGRRALVGLELALGIVWGGRMLRKTSAASAQEFIVRVLVAISFGFVLAEAYGGHSAIGGSFVVGVGLRAVHLASLCVWLGVLAATWMLSRRDDALSPDWKRVSTLAAIGLAVTGASGWLLSGRTTATVTALLATSYGRLLMAKMVVLIGLAIVGALAATRVGRDLPPRRIPFEIGLACVAIVFAALLASSAPARGERFLPLPRTEPQLVTSDTADLTVSASIEPARPGPNLVQLRVLETRRPSPGAVQAVTMTITAADGSVATKRTGVPDNGLLEWSDIAIASPGTYSVRVDIDRVASPVSPVTASWVVDPTPVPRVDTVVSTRRWAPIAFALAALWVVIVGVGRLIIVRRRSPRS